MYRIYIFSMVCLRHKRPTDEDGDRQHSFRVYRDPVNAACADTGMYSAGFSMHFLYL
jgi:hypothetical protein